MDNSAPLFDKLESILEKEHEYLIQTRRDHHLTWDNHILTLSTAAVAFSFTFLPLSGSYVLWLAFVGIFSFVVSIVFTTFNYVVTDYGIELLSKSHSARQMQHSKVRHRESRLNLELEKLEPGDENSINSAREQFWNDVQNIYAGIDYGKDQKDVEKNNTKIRFLNRAKTYSFLLGVFAITIFSLCNTSLIGKQANMSHNKRVELTSGPAGAGPSAAHAQR